MKKIWTNRLNVLLVMVSMGMLFLSCQESESLIYYDANAAAPIAIDANTLSVENLAGKSILKYAVPTDDNLLYVKAVYEVSPGVERQTQSSRFVDTLAIEGLVDAKDYTVSLYTVGKNKKESSPTLVTVSPQTSPLAEAFPSLNLIATFGGIEGTFSNLHKAALKAVLMADTADTGDPVFLQSFVINNPNASFSLRGLDAESTKFYVYLMDRWGNKTETKAYDLTPLYEERLDKRLWKEYKLPSDFRGPHENSPGYAFTGLFNDYIDPWDGWTGGMFLPEYVQYPRYFTIDLGVTAKISRFNLVPWWWRIYDTTPRHFEVYGSAIPNPGDDLNGEEWRLLGKFETTKPSGGDPGIITQEDINFAWPGGINIDVKPSELQPDPYFPVRIIRFKIISSWSNSPTVMALDELTIWGEVAK